MKRKYKDSKKPFKWKHFQGEMIIWTVRWYGRYALSYRDLKEMAAERGLTIARSTICRWVREYGSQLTKLIKPHLKMTMGSWRVDETYIKIKGVWHYLYRAIDKYGNTLDWMLSKTRDKKAAKKFFRKILGRSNIITPYVINVDKNPAYPAAHSELQKTKELPSSTKLRQVKYLNNGVENDHKFIKSKSRYRQWYQSVKTAACAIDITETMRVIQKGQLKYAPIGAVRLQNIFINKLLGLAA